MGFFDLFGRQPRRELQVESPWADPDILQRVTWSGLFPDAAESQWAPMTRADAMAVPAVAAARHRIVGTLSRLPLVAVNGDGAGSGWDRALGLIKQPDDAEPQAATMTRTYDDLLFDGDAWWLVVGAYSDAGRIRPRSVVQVANCHMDRSTNSPNPQFMEWLETSRGLKALTHPEHPGRPWLIYFVGPHPGLLTFGRTSIRAASHMERAAGHAADNPVPSVELHQTNDAPMTQGQIDALIGSWAKARRGENGGVAYTNSAIEAKMHGAIEAQLLVDGRNQAAVDVARLAGIPASSIDAGIPGTAITYANLTDRVTDLVNMGLQNYAVSVTGRLSLDDIVPHGVKVKLDYSELFPATPSTQPAPAGANERTPAP